MININVQEKQADAVNDTLRSIQVRQTKDRSALYADGKHSGCVSLRVNMPYNDLLQLDSTLAALSGVDRAISRGTEIICSILPEHDAFEVVKSVLGALQRNSFITDEECTKLSGQLALDPTSLIVATQLSNAQSSKIPTGNLQQR